jgi:Na+-driven multidrug efflux pump
MQGLAQGTQTLISQNYGAGYIDRAKSASRKLIFFTLIYSLTFVTVLMIFPTPFVKIFNSDPKLIELCTKLIRIFFIGMAFMGIQIACQNSFLALGKSKISLVLALLRKIILLIPLALILPTILGQVGIFVAECSADILAISITLICYLVLFGKYLNSSTLKEVEKKELLTTKKTKYKKIIYKKNKKPVIKEL